MALMLSSSLSTPTIPCFFLLPKYTVVVLSKPAYFTGRPSIVLNMWSSSKSYTFSGAVYCFFFLPFLNKQDKISLLCYAGSFVFFCFATSSSLVLSVSRLQTERSFVDQCMIHKGFDQHINTVYSHAHWWKKYIRNGQLFLFIFAIIASAIGVFPTSTSDVIVTPGSLEGFSKQCVSVPNLHNIQDSTKINSRDRSEQKDSALQTYCLPKPTHR